VKNNIINELRFASKKKKNAVLGYVYCDYLLDMFEENKRLNNIINKIREYAKNDDNFIILDVYSQDIVYGIQEDILNIVGSDKE
jgi:hypothetical protein